MTVSSPAAIQSDAVSHVSLEVSFNNPHYIDNIRREAPPHSRHGFIRILEHRDRQSVVHFSKRYAAPHARVRQGAYLLGVW